MPTDNQSRPFKDNLAEQMIETLEKNCLEHKIRFFNIGSGNQGIVHVVAPELRANSARNDNRLWRFSILQLMELLAQLLLDRYKPSKRCSCYPNHSHEQIEGKANLV